MRGLILIVEDERPIAMSVAFALRQEGFEAVTAEDGRRGLALARSRQPDLIILDLMIPEVDGLEFCRILRRESEVPIIMLTARAGEADRVAGLEMGADDYVVKPFSMRELVARVRAVLRRRQAYGPGVQNRVRVGDLVIDVDRHTVTLGGSPIALTRREFELLRVMASNHGRVVPREVLLDRVWGDRDSVDPKTLDVHIRWLREKIEEDPSHPRRLLTVRGVGYRYVGDAGEDAS
ncbi:MAG: response regulator [Armatimonadota bacterium]